MSSNSGSGQSGNKRRPQDRSDPRGAPSSGQPQFDIDPAEIDRYLSGRPQRSQERPDTTRPRSTRSTTDQIAQLRQMVSADEDLDFGEVPALRPRANQPTAAPRNQPVARPASADRTRSQSPAPRGVSTSSGQRTDAPRPRNQSPPSGATRPSFREDPYVDDPYANDLVYEEASYDTQAPSQSEYNAYDDEYVQDAPRIRGGQGSSRPTMPRVTIPALPRITVPQSVSQAAIFSDIPSLVLIGISVVSLAAMAILVGNQISSMPLTFATHVSASGTLENVRPRKVLWNLPLLSTMLTLMNVVIALFVARIDRFASRFILAAALVMQFIAWVAVFRII